MLLSTHVSLHDAIAKVKKDEVVKLVRFSSETLGNLLGRKISIAVAGLNPHASEGGMFGSEEADEIAPAIGQCKAEGIDVTGPYAPDTIFARYNGAFDAIIALSHPSARCSSRFHSLRR